jgi:hypothetical protein
MSFGKKLKGIQKFGKKAGHEIKKLGKKNGVLDQIERKTFNSLNNVVIPALAVAADVYAPGSGETVLKTRDGLQGIHNGIRGGVKQIQQIKKLKGDDRKEAIVNFGDNIGDVRREVNRSNTLLRDANTAVRAPQPTQQSFF